MAELRKTGESSYDILVDGRVVGQVWSWHGSWAAKAHGETRFNLKSRKQALEHVEKAHRLEKR